MPPENGWGYNHDERGNSMKYAVIDLGTNTIRLCIYQNTERGRELLLNQRVMALLGSKTENGALTENGIQTATDALTLLKTVAIEQGAEEIFVFATAALRNISNTEPVARTLEEQTGLTIDILSGEEEAELTFLGATESCHVEDGLIADIGGGSTELILVKSGKVVQSESFAIGSLTAFVRFVHERPAEREQIELLRTYVRSIIREKFPEESSARVLYGIGGAARTAYELEKILYPASGGAIQTLQMLLYRLLDDEKLAEKTILAASPDRLDTALPGTAILCEVAEIFGCKKLDICKGGVREGYISRKMKA